MIHNSSWKVGLLAASATALFACSGGNGGDKKDGGNEKKEPARAKGQRTFECKTCTYNFDAVSKGLGVVIEAKQPLRYRVVVVATDRSAPKNPISESFYLQTNKKGSATKVFRTHRLKTISSIRVGRVVDRTNMVLDTSINPEPGYPCSQCKYSPDGPNGKVTVSGTWLKKKGWYDLTGVDLVLNYKKMDGKLVEGKAVRVFDKVEEPPTAAGKAFSETVSVGEPFKEVTKACLGYNHKKKEHDPPDCTLVTGYGMLQKLGK